MNEFCTILQACEWIAFKYYPNGKRNKHEYKDCYLSKSDEYQEKIDEALIKLKRILSRFKSSEDIRGVYYKDTSDHLTNIQFQKDYILDIKNNGIIIENEHEINVILFEGDDENAKHYAPAYTDVEINFLELKKAKYFKHTLSKDINVPPKKGRKPKVNNDDFEKFFLENIDIFKNGKQEAQISEILAHFTNIRRTTVFHKLKACKEKFLSEK